MLLVTGIANREVHMCDRFGVADPLMIFVLVAQRMDRPGRIGLRVARSLEQRGFNVRLVERDMERCEKLSAKLQKTMIIHAEGTDIRVLLDEGVADADVFIAATENDETNILCSLLCKRHGTKRTLCLVNRPEFLDLAPSLGVDACVSPRLSAAASHRTLSESRYPNIQVAPHGLFWADVRLRIFRS